MSVIIRYNDNNMDPILEVFYTWRSILMGLLKMFSILLAIISGIWEVFCGDRAGPGCFIWRSSIFRVCVRVGGVRHLSLILVSRSIKYENFTINLNP